VATVPIDNQVMLLTLNLYSFYWINGIIFKFSIQQLLQAYRQEMGNFGYPAEDPNVLLLCQFQHCTHTIRFFIVLHCQLDLIIAC